MASEVFNITVENKFEKETTGKEIVVQVIPVHGSGHGGNAMPNTQAKQLKFTSSDGFIIFKIKCLDHEIGNKDYITVDTNHRVQLSVTEEYWRLKVARKQSNDPDQESPINIQVGRSESERFSLTEEL